MALCHTKMALCHTKMVLCHTNLALTSSQFLTSFALISTRTTSWRTSTVSYSSTMVSHSFEPLHFVITAVPVLLLLFLLLIYFHLQFINYNLIKLKLNQTCEVSKQSRKLPPHTCRKTIILKKYLNWTTASDKQQYVSKKSTESGVFHSTVRRCAGAWTPSSLRKTYRTYWTHMPCIGPIGRAISIMESRPLQTEDWFSVGRKLIKCTITFQGW